MAAAVCRSPSRCSDLLFGFRTSSLFLGMRQELTLECWIAFPLWKLWLVWVFCTLTASHAQDRASRNFGAILEYPATLIYFFVISISSFLERGIQTVVVRTCGVFQNISQVLTTFVWMPDILSTEEYIDMTREQIKVAGYSRSYWT